MGKPSREHSLRDGTARASTPGPAVAFWHQQPGHADLTAQPPPERPVKALVAGASVAGQQPADGVPQQHLLACQLGPGHGPATAPPGELPVSPAAPGSALHLAICMRMHMAGVVWMCEVARAVGVEEEVARVVEAARAAGVAR